MGRFAVTAVVMRLARNLTVISRTITGSPEMKTLAIAILVFAGCAGASARANAAYGNLVIANNDNDLKKRMEGQSGHDGSAKMGTDKGTHTGADQGVTPESDSVKVEQPARRNIPSSDDTKK